MSLIKYKKNFRLCFSALLLALTMCISELLAIQSSWPATAFNLMRYFAPAYIFSCILKNKADLKFLFYSLIITVLIMGLYSGYELLVGNSPVVDFVKKVNGDTYASLDNSFRYGIKRIQSFFIHPTSFSYFCVTLFTLLTLYVNNVIRYFLSIKDWAFVCAVVCLGICTFLTGTRSSILPLIIYIPFRLFKRTTNRIIYAFLLILCIFVLANLGSGYLLELYMSFVNNNNFEGSSTDMRNIQFAAALEYWSTSPLFGHGMAYAGTLYFNDPRLLGLESIWMPMLINYGLVGCLSYIYCLWSGYKLINFEKWKAIVFMLIILFINTTTSVPGLDLGFILAICTIIRAVYVVRSQLSTKKCLVDE